MYYLNKISICIRDKETVEDCKVLAETVASVGIAAEILQPAAAQVEQAAAQAEQAAAQAAKNAAQVEQAAAQAEQAAAQTEQAAAQTEQAAAEDGKAVQAEQAAAQTGILYLADDAPMARALQEAQLPVLIILHENNTTQDFSGFPYAAYAPKELDADFLERVYRRFQNIPWDICETQRLLIRETIEDDAKAFMEIYANPAMGADEERPYVNLEEEQAHIRAYRKNFYEMYQFGVWSLCLKETGRIIGRAGFFLRQDQEAIPELGYAIAVPFWGQGYAKEACLAILQFAAAELGFAQVKAYTRPDNAASQALLRKLGFTLTDEKTCRYQLFL